MKRSEMVEILTQKLENMVLDNEIDVYGFKHCGDALLNTLERAGMSPPKIKELDSHAVMLGMDPKQWEKEGA